MHRKGKRGGGLAVLLHTTAGERRSDEGAIGGHLYLPPGPERSFQELGRCTAGLAHLTLFRFLLKVPDMQRPSVDTTCKTDVWAHPASLVTQSCARAEFYTTERLGGTFNNNCTPPVWLDQILCTSSTSDAGMGNNPQLGLQLRYMRCVCTNW